MYKNVNVFFFLLVGQMLVEMLLFFDIKMADSRWQLSTILNFQNFKVLVARQVGIVTWVFSGKGKGAFAGNLFSTGRLKKRNSYGGMQVPHLTDSHL